eukprot:TRINITY_DN9921_c0_g1_i1.p1 TRINITY_DN9921_c0_g1~~TRINITY_DN9921_c0_g1_i1.p1  ORF type:complete len:210 (-),score=39.16 TRINITY_DN9921_c0_g1_i1:141-770(-)
MGNNESTKPTYLMDKIDHNLYLGSITATKEFVTLTNENIEYILTVCTKPTEIHQDITYLRLEIEDSSVVPIIELFEQAHQFIDEALDNNKGILVHCEAGMSRSASVVISYKMLKEGMLPGDAYKYVKGKRSIIAPNYGFIRQLCEYGRVLGMDGIEEHVHVFCRDYVCDAFSISDKKDMFDARIFYETLEKNEWNIMATLKDVYEIAGI